MPALQVRDFPSELYGELRAYAEANHRSIAQQTIACVEQELRRGWERDTFSRNAPDAIDGYDVHGGAGIMIPAGIREAERRSGADEPFRLRSAFEIESDAMSDVRRARWEKLRERFDAMETHWKGPKPTCEEVARMVRDSRDERSTSITGSVSADGGAFAGEDDR